MIVRNGMNMSALLIKNIESACFKFLSKRWVARSSVRLKGDIIDEPPTLELVEHNYTRRRGEPLERKKARLLYQSRQRGTLESGLILSSFADKYLRGMDAVQLDEYDKIINLPSNDWDIFYWAMGMKPTPEHFQNSVMRLLQQHMQDVHKADSNVCTKD